jgi:hypothetical protein
METMLKNLIKEAVLEALTEFTGAGVATMGLANPVPGGTNIGSGTGTDTGSDKGNGNSGNNNSGQGGGSADNSGGTPSEDGRPKPNVGVGVWSRR